MTIESRIQDFMSLHKGDLSRLLAKAEAALIGYGHDVEAMFADEPATVSTLVPYTIGPVPDPNISDTVFHIGDFVPAPTNSNGTEDAPQ